jgi:hypothetical protein
LELGQYGYAIVAGPFAAGQTRLDRTAHDGRTIPRAKSFSPDG